MVRGGGLQGLLRMPEVQRELKLEQAQIDLLQDMRPLRPAGPQGAGSDFRTMSPEEREKQLAAMRQAEEKQIAEVLDAKQLTRLKQLALQQSGARALAQKEVGDKLKLSAEQRQKIEAAMQAERDAMHQAFEGARPGGAPAPGGDRRQGFEKMQKLRASTETQLTAVLTSAQKTQFQQMQGAPFKFPEPQFGPGGPGRPGGRGGFGGPGGQSRPGARPNQT